MTELENAKSIYVVSIPYHFLLTLIHDDKTPACAQISQLLAECSDNS